MSSRDKLHLPPVTRIALSVRSGMLLTSKVFIVMSNIEEFEVVQQ